MIRTVTLGIVRVVSVAVVLLAAAPAHADLLTIAFTGEVDLTSEGGDVYPYSGFFAWNSATSPFESELGAASYALFDYNLIFDGADVSLTPSPEGIGNGLAVLDDVDALGTGPLDALLFYGAVGRPFNPAGDLTLVAALVGPTSMFSSTALPGSLDFLADLTTMFTLWQFEPDDPSMDEFFLDPVGTLNITGTSVTPIPEPGTLSLMALGVAGVLARVRRTRRHSR
jgi:hypothetical protein